MSKNYDLFCVFNPQANEEKIDASIAKIEKKVLGCGGSMVSVNKLGLRKVATRMRKFKSFKDGFFVHVVFASDSNGPSEITSLVTVNEDIMRFTLTKPIKEMKKSKKSKESAEAEAVVEVNPEMLIAKPE